MIGGLTDLTISSALVSLYNSPSGRLHLVTVKPPSTTYFFLYSRLSTLDIWPLLFELVRICITTNSIDDCIIDYIYIYFFFLGLYSLPFKIFLQSQRLYSIFNIISGNHFKCSPQFFYNKVYTYKPYLYNSHVLINIFPFVIDSSRGYDNKKVLSCPILSISRRIDIGNRSVNWPYFHN